MIMRHRNTVSFLLLTSAAFLAACGAEIERVRE